MSTQVEYNLEEVITGNADSIIAKLSDIPTASLLELQRMEGAMPSPRKTVFAALEAEIAGRDDRPEPKDDSAEGADVAIEQQVLAAQAKKIEDLERDAEQADEIFKSIVGGLKDRGFAIEPGADLVGNVFSAIDVQAAEIGKLKAQLEALAPRDPSIPAPTPDQIVLSKRRGKAKLPIKAYQVVPADSTGRPIEGLPPLEFEAEAFSHNREMLRLDREIKFGPHIDAEEIHALWLVDGNKNRARCSFVIPLAVGGGRACRIPAGYASFREE